MDLSSQQEHIEILRTQIANPSAEDIAKAQRAVRQRKERLRKQEEMMVRALAKRTGDSPDTAVQQLVILRSRKANPNALAALRKRINAKFHRGA